MRALAVTRVGLRSAFTNLLLALLWLAFAYTHLMAFAAKPRPSLVLLVAFETLFAAFLVLRRDAPTVSRSFADWTSTMIGTFTPFLLRPTGAGDLWLGQLVQVMGLVLAIAGLLSLNRSIGLLPANRGVCTGGIFHAIRHPLYSAYLVGHLGYLTTHLSVRNVAVVAVTLAAQLVRIRREEALLSRDPAYKDYVARTRWRLIPLIY